MFIIWVRHVSNVGPCCTTLGEGTDKCPLLAKISLVLNENLSRGDICLNVNGHL